MSEPKSTTGHLERAARLRWVPISKIRKSPVAQREINQSRVDALAADFDLEQLGFPTVSFRDDWYWIIDGQHRIEALKQIGWGDQQVQCQTYEGLTEQQEAERFLKLNNVLAVDALARHRVGVEAGREIPCDIDRIVRANGCIVSNDSIPGAIGAIGTLGRIYNRAGGVVMSRAIRLSHKSYGDPGLDAPVLDGMGYLAQRYNGALDDETAIQRLSGIAGGVNGLLGRAEVIRRQTGIAKGQTVAAAAVEIINQGKGGKKLKSWWAE